MRMAAPQLRSSSRSTWNPDSSSVDRYLFRVDRKAHLRNIRDGFFRAARWRGAGDFPHKELVSAATSAPEGIGIYRVCFYSSHERAVKSLETDYRFWNDGVITRVRHEDVLDLGFHQTWDDGFEKGDAYLFWQYGRGGNNPDWSEAGIPLTLLQVHEEGSWMSFSDVVEAPRAKSLTSMARRDGDAATGPIKRPSLLSRIGSMFQPRR